MAGQNNAAPIIIKRKKVIQGGGHHGGAWKVAYADFVTAMMAFFMLMWLLNATTEKQRKGIADYFNPTIPVNRVSGGGDGAFGGDSVFSEETLAKNGMGGSSTTESQTASTAATPQQSAANAGEGVDQALEDLTKVLAAKGGESMTMERLMRHVVTRVTDEGLVIEIFDLDDVPLFDGDTDAPTETLRGISDLMAEVLQITTNKISVDGFTKSYPITLIDNPVWSLSSDRAQAMRVLLATSGMNTDRFSRVIGHADRNPVTENETSSRNNRIEIILLRKDR
jgi:chemotaxis protein MotB